MNKKETALLSVPRGESAETTRFLQRVKQVIDYIAANAGTGDGSGSTTLSKGAFVKLYKEVAQGGLIPPSYEDTEFIEGLLDALNGKITNSQLHKDLGATIAKIDKNETAISIETQERIADILAATEAINGNRAAIIQESTTRTTEFEAVNTQLGVLVTKTDGNTASIVAEALARTTADSAQVSRLDALDVVTADGSARIGTLETAVVENKTAITTAKTELRAEFDSTINGVGPDSITNRIEKNRAAIQLESEVRAGEISAYAAQQAIIQTTVNGHTASIQEIWQSVDGSSVNWQIRADVNGVIGGIGFTNDGATVDFVVRASTFAIAGSSGSASTPFTVVPNDIVIDGVNIPAGTYLERAFIRRASIDTLDIKGNAVTVPVSAFTESAIAVGNTYTTIQSLFVPADMGHTTLNFNAIFNFPTYDRIQSILCRVLKSGVVVADNIEVFFSEARSASRTSTSHDGGSHTHSASFFGSGGASGTVNVGYASASSHSHTVDVANDNRNAGSFSLARHDSTSVAGVYELQMRVSNGNTANITQRYIHAMTMRR